MVFKKMIAPSVLSADFGRLAEEIKAVEKAGADVIHVDVMDGHFVPNITIGPVVVEAIRKATKLPVDVHLMIENPQNYIKDFLNAGANWISVHAEEGCHLDRTMSLIRDGGAKAGVVLNPATPVADLEYIIQAVDFVLLMTVNPGFGGQKFIPYCKEKITHLREWISAEKLDVFIEIDGGVKAANIGELSRCGADVFVAGSAIFESKNYKKTISDMRKAIG